LFEGILKFEAPTRLQQTPRQNPNVEGLAEAGEEAAAGVGAAAAAAED